MSGILGEMARGYRLTARRTRKITQGSVRIFEIRDLFLG